MGFRAEIRNQIRSNAGHVSEISGRSDRPLQCAHIFHDKTNPDYNSPDNGILLTDEEHFCHHWVNRHSPNLIGLTKDENNQSIAGLWGNIVKFDQKSGLSRADSFKQTVTELLEILREQFKYTENGAAMAIELANLIKFVGIPEYFNEEVET